MKSRCSYVIYNASTGAMLATTTAMDTLNWIHGLNHFDTVLELPFMCLDKGLSVKSAKVYHNVLSVCPDVMTEADGKPVMILHWFRLWKLVNRAIIDGERVYGVKCAGERPDFTLPMWEFNYDV